ncbi:MAG TPA: RsmE family RNA methyltransferase [Planctomycetota bacterium]|nr:RsmE family RNA methyltransferase [Planctomycetota bacterium]
MARRYLIAPLPEGDRARLVGDLAHHLATVLRVEPGTELLLFDGNGQQRPAQVLACDRAAVEVALGPLHRSTPPRISLQLAFAPPKWSRAEWLFEHGTEVGVGSFQPLVTERTRPQGDKLERWQKLCVAAAGQCDRAFVPAVRPVRDLLHWLAQPGLPPQRFLAAVGSEPLQPLAAGDAVLLVGPEGGLSAAETAAVRAAGFLPRGLGAQVLRTETAALVGAALLLRDAGTAG